MARVAPTLSFLIVGIVQAANATSVTPASVEQAIAKRGAKATVDEMSAAGTWDQVVRAVAAGLPAWIRLAPSLSEGSDAGTAEQLGDSLTKALPKAPSTVLAVLDPSGRSVPRSPEVVCSASFFEGDPMNVPRYRTRALAAVGQVRDPRLTAARQACLAHLRASGR